MVPPYGVGTSTSPEEPRGAAIAAGGTGAEAAGGAPHAPVTGSRCARIAGAALGVVLTTRLADPFEDEHPASTQSDATTHVRDVNMRRTSQRARAPANGNVRLRKSSHRRYGGVDGTSRTRLGA